MVRKQFLVWLCLLMHCILLQAQTKTTVEQAVEGGKVLVELIKVFSNDKEKNEATGCKGKHADLCVVNQRDTTLTVILVQRGSNDTRELVITTSSRECCLELPIGVWTYELRLSGMQNAMRKGDLLIEECNNMTMTVK